MAVGFDLTPYIKYGQENVIAVRIDNDWNYKERATGTKYQWSNKNFNANYGGIPKMYGCTSPTVCIRLYLYIVISKRPESTSMPKTSV